MNLTKILSLKVKSLDKQTMFSVVMYLCFAITIIYNYEYLTGKDHPLIYIFIFWMLNYQISALLFGTEMVGEGIYSKNKNDMPGFRFFHGILSIITLILIYYNIWIRLPNL